MSNLLTIPLQDDFETTLSSLWNGWVWTVNVNSTPAGTMPTGKFSYIVVNPWEANMQVAKIDWRDSIAKTINVTSIAVKKWVWVNYSAVSHASNAVVRFSNNYQFREDLQTAINSKLEWSALGNFIMTLSKLYATWDMLFQDDNTPSVSLSQLASNSWADQKVRVSVNDTTSWVLNDKINARDWLKQSILNPSANEVLALDIDLLDKNAFVNASWTLFTPAFLTWWVWATSVIATRQAITNGSFRITINGTQRDITWLNFSTDTTMDMIASRIQTAIRALTSSLETVVWSTNKFIISSVNTTSISAITVASAQWTGTDISWAWATNFLDCDTWNGVVTNKVVVSDAWKGIVLDSNGLVDPTLLPAFLQSKTGLLGETISSAWVISFMGDWKIYKKLSNMRTFTWNVTGHTSTKSCLLPNNKIATVWRTWNNLTIYIGTIDYTANTITYWSWVAVSSSCANNDYYTICKAWTDSVFVWYTNSAWNSAVKGNAISISGTTPSVWAETAIQDSWYGTRHNYAEGSCYVANGKIAIATSFWDQYWSHNNYVIICTLSWTTLTLGTASAWVAWWYGMYVEYIADNVIAYTDRDINSTSAYIILYTVSWTVATYWSTIAIWNGWSTWSIATDWTYIRVSWSTNLYRYTFSWNTLTQIFAVAFPNAKIYISWNMIWTVSWTTIVRYSQTLTGVTQRNTIDYWVSPAQSLINSSTWYCMISLTTNPSTVYKIGNEDRNVIWYINTTWSLWDTKTIYVDWDIVTWLTNIIPWAIYYVSSTWSIDFNWVQVFGRWLSTTSIKIHINIT